jgi:hypothetical protein
LMVVEVIEARQKVSALTGRDQTVEPTTCASPGQGVSKRLAQAA